MAVLSARAYVPVRNKTESSAKAGVADTFYQGGLAFLTTSGLTPVPAAGMRIGGIVTETTVAAVGTEVPIMVGGIFGVPNTNFLNSSPGEPVYADVNVGSDNPADIIVSGVGTLASDDFTIGRVQAYDVDGKTWILLGVETDPTRIA